MESKHVVGIVAILAAGAVGVTVLVMHPWTRNEDWRHDRFERQEAQQAQRAADVNQPVDAQVTTPTVTPAPVIVQPGPVNVAGQALTVTFPTEDEVEVYRDNIWVPARIERRDRDRVFVRYADRGGAVTEWVGPQRVRSSHDSRNWMHRP